jgi:hypothetical protein
MPHADTCELPHRFVMISKKRIGMQLVYFDLLNDNRRPMKDIDLQQRLGKHD